jgi:hypothetical protein
MRWDALPSEAYLVPQSMWYIHTRADTPKVDPATWRLQVDDSLGHTHPLRQPYNANGLSYGAVVSHPVLVK